MPKIQMDSNPGISTCLVDNGDGGNVYIFV